MKRILIVLLLILAGCSKAQDIEEVIDYDEPTVYLNHELKDIMPTSQSLKEMGTCYEIFPISFADSNEDGYGDINGITENLDYFVDLGVECLWLTPVTESPSYHKYDVTDYYKIDPIFGTNEDYTKLLKKTEELGIKVLMDFVINHTSSKHKWFIESQNPSSEYRDYYRWADLKNKDAYPTYEGWHRFNNMYYYGSFWDQMPDLNLDNPKVRKEIMDIAKYWIELGVDGFRLDAAKHYFDVNEYPRGTSTINEDINFLRELNFEVKKINPDAIILTEVWSDASVVAKYFAGTDTSFNFELSDDIVNTINNGNDIGLVENLIKTRTALSELRSDFVDSIFLTNHDQDRLISRLDNSTIKAKLASNMLFTLPGVSWVYYGEEVGMSGYNRHENIRQPFIWNNEYQTEGKNGGIDDVSLSNNELNSISEQFQNEDSLLNHYKKLIELKNDPVLKYGDISEVSKTKRKILAFVRSYEGRHYLVLHSLSMVDQEITLDSDVLDVIYDSGEALISDKIIMKSYKSLVLEVDSNIVSFE
ncbi:alpha-amylase family glycosyl hydrolase [Mycoplasmatota bacterium WC44]